MKRLIVFNIIDYNVIQGVSSTVYNVKDLISGTKSTLKVGPFPFAINFNKKKKIAEI